MTDSPHPHRRSRSRPHPQVALHRCEELAQTVRHLGLRDVHQDKLAEEMGYSNTRVGPYLSIRAASRYFGLVEYRGQYISLTQAAQEALRSENEEDLARFRMEAVQRPALYRRLLEMFVGKQLPSVDALAEELIVRVEELGILRDAAGIAAPVFLESLHHAGLINEQGYLLDPEEAITRLAAQSVRDAPQSLTDAQNTNNFGMQTVNKVDPGTTGGKLGVPKNVFTATITAGEGYIKVALPSSLSPAAGKLIAQQLDLIKGYVELASSPAEQANGKPAQ